MGLNFGTQPITAWVIDHPAHVHILNQFIQGSNKDDIVFAVERPEVHSLISGTTFHGRPLHWLPRPAGPISKIRRFLRAVRRQRLVKRILLQHGRIERLVSINAPLEIRAALRAKISQRILVLDVERDHLVQRLSVGSATRIAVPTDWMDDLAHRCMSSHDLIRLQGPWAHLYVNGGAKPPANKNILIRRLKGDGNHDSDEMVSVESFVENISPSIIWDEDTALDDPWCGPTLALDAIGVISQSVTVAIEAVLLGRPVLLVSRAQRGVIDGLIARGAPLLRWTSENDILVFEHWTECLENSPNWSDPQGADVIADWMKLLVHRGTLN